MKVTKNKGMSLALVLIVLTVFNAIAFIIPFEQGGSFWVGYGFATLAILLTVGVVFFVFGREGLRSKFYGIPLISVVWTYLVVQMIASLLQMAIPLIPYRYGILLNIILLAICLIGLIGVNMGREEVERVDAKVREKVFYLKSLQGDVEGMAVRVQDVALQKALKGLAETLRFSDPMSTPQLAAIENKIGTKAAVLGDCLMDVPAATALCDELQQLFAERNRKCKLLK